MNDILWQYMSEGSMLMPYPDSHWCSQQPPVALQYLQFGIVGIQASNIRNTRYAASLTVNNNCSCCWESADSTPYSRITVQHDDGVAKQDVQICMVSLVRNMSFNLFAKWHQHVWFKRWRVWRDKVGVRGLHEQLQNCVARGHFPSFYSLIQTLFHRLFAYATGMAHNNS